MSFLLPSDKLDVAFYFPNSGVALVASVGLCDGHLCFAGSAITHGHQKRSCSYIVKYVFFPHLYIYRLKGEGVQRICNSVSVLNDLVIVGVGK